MTPTGAAKVLRTWAHWQQMAPAAFEAIAPVQANDAAAALRAGAEALEEAYAARKAKRRIEAIYEVTDAADPTISALTPILLDWDNTIRELQDGGGA